MIALALGWIGTVGTFGAYVLLSRGLWHPASIRYAALNGVAGLLGAMGSSLYGAWPSVVSNLLWSGVAAHSIIVTSGERRDGRRDGSGEPSADPELRADARASAGAEPPAGDVLVLARAA